MKINRYLLNFFIAISLAMPLSANSADGIANVNKQLENINVTQSKSVQSKASAYKKQNENKNKIQNEDIYKNTLHNNNESNVFFQLIMKMIKALAVVLISIGVLFGLIKMITKKQKNYSNNIETLNGDELDLSTPKTISGAVAKFVKKNL